MFEYLASGHAVTIIVDEHARDDFLGVGRYIWDQLCDTRTVLVWEVELHVRCHSIYRNEASLELLREPHLPLELGEEFRIGRSENVMNFVHLIKLVVPWE